MRQSINFMIFALGVAVGSIVTRTCIKKKYEEIAQEEINSVKEVFSKRENASVKEAGINKQTDKPDIVEYASYSDAEKRYDIQRSEKIVKENEYVKDTKGLYIYVITPDEFGELPEYERISLTYYDDQVLTDENDKIIEDIEETIGIDSLTHFGEYEDDSVFVRNDERQCDYEILLDRRKYSDVIKKKSRFTED